MQAYLVTGQSLQKRSEEIKKLVEAYGISPLNLLTFNPSPSHGIETIRDIIHILSTRTTKHNQLRGIFIDDAHLMTVEAQNAFLKTLEEPPGDTIIILAAPREDLLLPTITSRCLLIQTAPQEIEVENWEEQKELFEKLSASKIGEKVTFAEQTGKDRGEALIFVNDQLAFFNYLLYTQSGKVKTNLGKALLAAYQDLSRNVNPKMVLFELLKNY